MDTDRRPSVLSEAYRECAARCRVAGVAMADMEAQSEGYDSQGHRAAVLAFESRKPPRASSSGETAA